MTTFQMSFSALIKVCTSFVANVQVYTKITRLVTKLFLYPEVGTFDNKEKWTY